MEQYQSFLDQIQTFDLIGFRGHGCIGGILSRVQKNALSDKYRQVDIVITHVGLAVRGDDLNKLPDNILSKLKGYIDSKKVYLFESSIVSRTSDKIPDVFGNFPKGCKLRPLDDIVLNFNGNVYYSTHTFSTTDEMLHRFVGYIIENEGVPYEESPIVLLSSVFQCIRKNHKRTDSVFCSELVAKVLIELNLLPKEINPEYVVPLDFYIKKHNPITTYDVDKQIPIMFKLPNKMK